MSRPAKASAVPSSSTEVGSGTLPPPPLCAPSVPQYQTALLAVLLVVQLEHVKLKVTGPRRRSLCGPVARPLGAGPKTPLFTIAPGSRAKQPLFWPAKNPGVVPESAAELTQPE